MPNAPERIRILHVDDDPELAETVAAFLRREDDRLAVELATNASEGLEMLADQEIDCVVSDYEMPGQNGVEFLTAVRERHPDLPFILYTGKGSEEVASEAISAGVTDYLQKEGGTDQYAVLANRITNAVESHRSRRALEERTRELQRYERMINSMQEAACIYDERGRFEVVNEYLADWYDTSRESLKGRESNLIPSIRERADGEDPYRALLEGRRKRVDGEVEATFAGHGEAVLEYRLTPFLVDGSIEGVVGVARDITKRKRRERELLRNERAMDEAPVGITISDPSQADNPIVYANDRFVEMTGYDRTAALGRNCRFLQGEGTEPEPVAEMRDAIDSGEPTTVELRNYRKGGTEFWNRVSIAPVRDESGAITNWVGFQQDLTAHHRREQVLREMHDIISDRHQSFEEQVQALLELGREELDTEYGTLSRIRGDDYLFEVVASDDDSVEAGEVVPLSSTNCERVASAEQTLVLGDVERDAPEETDRAGFAEWGIACYLGAPVLVDEGVYGTVCFYDTEARSDQFSEWEVTLVDLMSRWVSYELQRRQANERLQEKNEQLEEFASIVSHDLRNPLNVAKLQLELEQEERDSEHLEAVARAHERMGALIEDLLALARQGTQTTESTAVELGRVVERCWETVDTQTAQLRVGTDRTVLADENRLRQLLENLIRNAVEHGSMGSQIGDGSDDAVEHGPDGEGGTEERCVTITVGDLPGGFYVEDDGPGISSEEREQIFEAGYSTAEAGTGFGLNIVAQIVAAHDWEIAVTESEAGGARFEITGVEFPE